MTTLSFISEYLRTHGFAETAKTLEKENGKPIPPPPHAESLDDILADRLRFLDISESKPDEGKGKWTTPYEETAKQLGISEKIVDCAIFGQLAAFSTPKKEVLIVDLQLGQIRLRESWNVVVKKIVAFPQFLVLIGMDGKATIGHFDGTKGFLWQVHSRLVVDAVAVGKNLLVSAGWDKKVKLTVVGPKSADLLAETDVDGQITTIDANIYKNEPVVVVGKANVLLLDVFVGKSLDLKTRVALNDAEFSAYGLTPRWARIGRNSNMLAVTTSQEPNLRLLLIPIEKILELLLAICRNSTVANYNTHCPVDKYSLGQFEWRDDESGLWVFGDDDVIRGIDAGNGSVVVEMVGGRGIVGNNVLLTLRGRQAGTTTVWTKSGP